MVFNSKKGNLALSSKTLYTVSKRYTRANMNISIELLITIGSFAFLVAAFFVTRSRDMADKQRNMISDAEDKGRLLQRIDQLEKSVDDAHGKCRDNADIVSLHGTDITRVTGDVDSLKAMIDRVEKKLDRVLEKSQQGI